MAANDPQRESNGAAEHLAPNRPDPVAAVDAEAELTAELAAELEPGLEAAEHPARSRRWWSLPLRLVISAAMVWFLVHKIADVSFGDLLPTWTATTIAWLAVCLVLTLAGVVLAAARWQQVLVAMDVPRPPFRRLVSHYFAGQFVSNVLPTTIGGDVLRASRLARDTGDTADSFASLIIERLCGWLVLPLLTAIGFALNPDVRGMGQATTLALAISGGTLAGLIAILFIADHPKLGGRFAEREGWRRFIGSVHLGVARLRRHPGSAVNVVIAGIAYQVVLVLAATAGARALGMDRVTITVMLALFPAVLISQVLPIGISGLGVREGALVIFLSPLGIPKEQAVALGLLLFLVNLVVSVLGAPAFVTGARRGQPDQGASPA